MTTPDGRPREWVSETQFPSPSTTQTWVVSLDSRPPALRRGTWVFSPLRMRSAIRAPYSFEVSSASGVST